MVYSSSALIADEYYYSMYFFIFRQMAWVLAGSVALYVGMQVDYRKWASISRALFFVVLLLLLAVLISPLGHTVGGARRWLRLGPVGFQPSEMAKVAAVIYLAATMQRKYYKKGGFNKSMVAPLAALMLLIFLIYRQPDFGTAVFIIIICAATMFAGGIRFRYIFGAALAGFPLLMFMLLSRPYRRERLLTFMDPMQDIYGSGFQLYHSLTALGSGGLRGLGLGTGFHKLFYIPEVHTDFVFAVIGQEIGFMGTLTVLILFIIFAWRGFKISLRQEDYLGRVMAAGLTFLIVLQAGLNVAVVTGTFPTKGLPLPFISFGGSSLVFNMFAVGVLLNISKTCWKGKR